MDTKRVGLRVRSFRKLKGYTQQELADSAGISLALLGAVERGNRRLEEQILNKIAVVLGVSLEELSDTSSNCLIEGSDSHAEDRRH